MMKNYFKILALSITFIMLGNAVMAQYSTKKVSKKHQEYTDSLKNLEYDRIMPVWGAGAYKQGFDIPYPVGFSLTYIMLDQGLDITNMQLGITTDRKDIPLTNVDEFIKFGDNTNLSHSVSFRPDVWIFPFLNVYGLFGSGRSHTEVNLVAPVSLLSVVDQGVTTMGVGVLGAGGFGPVWVSVDANFTWNQPELTDQPTRVNVVGVRVGHSFKFKKRPDRNISVWVGGMYMKMTTETSGAITMSEAFPDYYGEGGTGQQKRQEVQEEYDDWYADLSPIKKAAVDKTPIPEFMEDFGDKYNDGSTSIKYGMDKQTAQYWNYTFGAQFQLNKSWQFRAEAGLIGDRESLLFGLNYRILGPKRKEYRN